MASSAAPSRRGRQTLHEQIQKLAERVAALERARTEEEGASTHRPIAGSTGNDYGKAAIEARMKASREYYDQKWLKYYRAHPDALKKELEEEQQHDAFLRDRGATPRESDLKKYATLLAQEAPNAAGRRSSGPSTDGSAWKLRTSAESTSQISHTRQAAAEDETDNH